MLIQEHSQYVMILASFVLLYFHVHNICHLSQPGLVEQFPSSLLVSDTKDESIFFWSDFLKTTALSLCERYCAVMVI